MNGLELAVDVLAVHRLTRLVTADTITEPIRWQLVTDSFTRAGVEIPNPGDDAAEIVRSAVEMGLPERYVPKVAALLTCRWCTSVWVAGGVVLVRRTRWWRPLALLLAFSSASTLVAGAES